MTELSEDTLYQDPDLAQFYDPDNGLGGADHDYCASLAERARSVLDLGCGTGQLAARLAEGRTVYGADPAAAMLDLARRRPGGERVTWVRGTAQALRLGRRFDLVLLTGHAFQVFLDEADRRAVLATIAEHLAPGGRFIFDTRNPARESWRLWTPEATRRRFEHPGLGTIEAWNDAARDPDTGVVTYETHYRVAASGRGYAAASKICFTSRDALDDLIADAGLAVDTWLGDWSGAPYDPSSKEIIPLGRLP